MMKRLTVGSVEYQCEICLEDIDIIIGVRISHDSTRPNQSERRYTNCILRMIRLDYKC